MSFTTDRQHVVLLTGTSSYGVLSHLTVDLAEAFLACGWTAEIIDLSRLSIRTELHRLEREGGAGFFCAYSGYGADLLTQEGLFYDVVGVPYVGLMLDNPCYFPDRHWRASPNLVFLHGDDGHHDVSVEISPPDSWRGVFRLAVAPWHRPMVPLAERSHAMLFASKGGDPDAYAAKLRMMHDAPSCDFLFDVADALGATPAPQRVWDVAKARMAAAGLSTGVRLQEKYHALVAHADHLARLRKATAVARALRALPVTFVGGAWDHVASTGDRARFLPPAGLPAVRALMADSRTVLNVQPGTTDSMHDRLLLGLHAGAATISDSNRVIDSLVGADAFVRWDGDPTHIADVVSETLRDLPAADQTAGAGYRLARERLTLERMASGIVQTVALHRALRAAAPTPAAPAAISSPLHSTTHVHRDRSGRREAGRPHLRHR